VIDLHCHILPALDDGAIDIEDSVAMARQAQDDGIEIVCATPHIHPDHQVRTDQLRARVEVVNQRFEQERIATRVACGGEIAETLLEDLSDRTLREVSLGENGVWLLVEPRPGAIGASLVEAIGRLGDRGFRAVVAHPERHAGERFRETLEELVARGALVQATAALVATGPASPTLLELAGAGLVHLLGSDAHSSRGGRPVRLSEGLARLAELERTRPHLGWIAKDGPAAILAGRDARPPFAR
jgi:protein-tyrosine phosphatase